MFVVGSVIFFLSIGITNEVARFTSLDSLFDISMASTISIVGFACFYLCIWQILRELNKHYTAMHIAVYSLITFVISIGLGYLYVN